MLTRVHITSLIVLTIVTWLICLLYLGESELSLSFLRPFGVIVATVVAIVSVFTRWAWALPVFHGWYVKRPDVRGTWKAELQSNWKDPSTGEVIPPITAYIAVRQTLSTLNIRLMTPDSTSRLIAHNIELEKDGLYRIAGIYRNEPRLELRGERSEIHLGSLLLEVHGMPPNFMEGHYWTDRGTRGTIKVHTRIRDTFESYVAASDAFK